MAQYEANIVKYEIGRDKENNPLMAHKFVDSEGKECTNYNLISTSEDGMSVILEDLSPQA